MKECKISICHISNQQTLYLQQMLWLEFSMLCAQVTSEACSVMKISNTSLTNDNKANFMHKSKKKIWYWFWRRSKTVDWFLLHLTTKTKDSGYTCCFHLATAIQARAAVMRHGPLCREDHVSGLLSQPELFRVIHTPAGDSPFMDSCGRWLRPRGQHHIH